MILGLPEGNLLIDTSPDLREQLLREKIGIVHSVLYTHEHADHIFGLDDLRMMQFYLGGPGAAVLRAEGRRSDSQVVRLCVRRCRTNASRRGAATGVSPNRLGAVRSAGCAVVPIRMQHGKRFEVLGFRFGNIAYCTDASFIPPESMERLAGLDVLILDALRPRGHATHFSLEQAVEIARELKPRQTYFTHMSHELEHEATNASLPPGMALAYDGLRTPTQRS